MSERGGGCCCLFVCVFCFSSFSVGTMKSGGMFQATCRVVPTCDRRACGRPAGPAHKAEW